MGEISPSNVMLKKKWIWDVLEVKWGNTCITLNNKEIHLPTILLVPLIHKTKVRKLFNKINLNACLRHAKTKTILVQS